MADIKKLQYEGKDIYPITHIEAIVDDEGKPIKDSYVTVADYQKGSAFQVPTSTSNNEIRELNTRSAAIADEIQNSTLGTLIDKVGDLNALQVSDKTNAVTAVNSLINNITTTETAMNSKVDTSTYNNKIGGFNSSLTNINNAQENVKQKIVNVLVNKEIEASKNEDFTSLINKIGQVEKNKKTAIPAILRNTPMYFERSILPLQEADQLTSLIDHSVVLHNDVIYIFGGSVVYKDEVNQPNYRFYKFNTITGELINDSIINDQNSILHYESRSVSYNNLIYTAGVFVTYSGNNTYYGICAFDPQLKTWTNKKVSTDYTNYYPCGTMSLVGDNIYFIGGFNINNEQPVNVSRAFNLKTNTYTSKKTPTNYTPVYASSVVVNNSVYVIGGANNTDSFYRNNMRYDISSNSWTSRAQIPETAGLALHESVLYNNMIYIIGGHTYDWVFPMGLYRYDITNNRWEFLYSTDNIEDPNGYAHCFGGYYNAIQHKCIIQNNLVYAIGGTQYGYIPLDVACFILK